MRRMKRPCWGDRGIIMRDENDGKKKQVPYLETPAVTEMRDNLMLINRCLASH
jgi:hypothetical protein